MLSKLFKYEIKATGRIFLPFVLSVLVFAGINRFIFAISPPTLDTPAVISMAIYIVIMVAMFVMTFIVMIQRFYRNLLSDEGYLMFTLPTKAWQHIASKFLVSMLWMVISVFIAMISILIITLDKKALSQIVDGLTTILNQVFQLLGASVYLLTFEIFIITLLSLASGILIVYASIAIGHLFRQHKTWASFGAFIVLNTLSQILFIPISLIPGIDHIQISSFTDFVALQSQIQLVLVYGIISSGLLCVAYFAITNLILSKHLNLE